VKFDTFVFAAFLALVFPTYWAIRDRRAQNLFVLAASYVFYGWWDARFLLLLVLTTAFDWAIGRALDRVDAPIGRRRLIAASVTLNLAVLGLFKYFDFFVESAGTLAASLGIPVQLPTLRLVLPVGISFYTFQSMSYTIDVYRRVIPAERSLVAFAAYVAFFPQLVAGPIERAASLLPRFAAARTLTREGLRTGLTFVVYGLVKKVAIADNVAPISDLAFARPLADLTGPWVLLGTVAFAVQIYADFSGYSDIARGVARLFGFDLMANFRRPYVSATPSEFWRRWHISLSSWLRDYLYVPLGGNRGGPRATYRNLLLTMGLGGLWHGAAWNFVLWGLYHGVLLSAYRALGVEEAAPRWSRPVRLGIAVPVFFVFTLYGWLLFRAESLEQVAAMTAALGSGWTGPWGVVPAGLAAVAWFFVPIGVHHLLARKDDERKWAPAGSLGWLTCNVSALLYATVQGRASAQAFIYFQF